MNLNIETWKEFKIGDLFSYERGKESAPNQNINGDTWIISEVSTNNGYVRKVKPTKVFDSHCITVSVNFAQTVYYQPKEFCASVNIMILRPLSEKIGQRQLLFIASVLSKLHKKFSYTDKISKDILLNEKISLPAKLYTNSPKYHPDWEFMEEYIKYIENKKIEEVDKFHREEIDKALKVAGLTEEDLDGDLNVEPAGMYCEFKVSDLFESVKTRGVNNDGLNKNFDSGAYRYITRTSFNNGISGLTGKINNLNPQPANSFSLGLLNMDFFFQSKKWYSGQFVRGIIPKFKINKILALYFKTLLDKRSDVYKKGLVRDFDETFLNDRLILPAIDEKTPDFEYMEKAIYIYIY